MLETLKKTLKTLKENPSVTFWGIVAAAVVVLVVRILQVIFAVDPNNGFFRSDSSFMAYLLYVLLILMAVGLVFLTIRDKKKSRQPFTVQAEEFLPKQTAVLGVLFLVGAICCFVQLVLDFKKPDLNFIGNVLVFLTYLAIAFLLLGNKRVKAANGYIALILAISYTLKAGALFMTDTVIIRISDELLTLLAYIFAVMFFVSTGRFFAKSESRSSRYKLIFFAAGTALLTVASTGVKYPLTLLGVDSSSFHINGPSLSEIGLLVVAVGMLAVLYLPVKNSSKPVSDGAENEAP